ncbi:hypothetical protein GY45DRAFT_1370954 [Cubamyces sp. BRFM 1775]|nr:hypothetical protein GY45DRAFT_1370954 [Cubamyces sp. BRFM 1775]
MPPPKTRSKPRFALFNVGKSKASPARAASTKRASLRHSAIRTDALKLPPELLLDAGQPVPRRLQGGEASTSDPKDTQRGNASQIPSRGDDNISMKDSALPPLPNDRTAAALAHPSSTISAGPRRLAPAQPAVPSCVLASSRRGPLRSHEGWLAELTG